MDASKLREAARERIEALPAETAAGNTDPESAGPDVAFGASDDDAAADPDAGSG
jgi:hypothetical protein